MVAIQRMKSMWIDINGLQLFDKKAGDTSTQIGTGVPENQELAKGLHRFITIKCERAKVH